MTEENVGEIQDRALGQVMRLKQTLAIAKERMNATGREMSKVGGEIKDLRPDQWAGFSFNKLDWLNVDALKNLANDIVTAEDEYQKAIVNAMNLGVALPSD